MMPMVLNIALFSIQPGVMPFRMDFLAFVKSYFALASFVCVVWVILSQWDTLMAFACHARQSFGDIVHKSPKTKSRTTDEVESRDQRNHENSNFAGEIRHEDGISSTSENLTRNSFRDKFSVRRGDRGATSRAADYC